jgi:cobalt/nickel transport system permease protein
LQFDLFFDIFTFRDNALSRLDPRVKLLVALWAILAVVISQGPLFPALVLGLTLTGMAFVRLPLGFVLFRLLAPLGTVVVLLVIKSLFYGSTPIFGVRVLGWQIVLLKEGLLSGIILSLRVLGSVSVVILLSSVMPSHQIFRTLAWLRLPKEWLEVAMMMYRYTFVLIESVTGVMAAQWVRLGYFGIRRSLQSLGVLSGAVIVQSLEQAQKTHEAMVARGYQGRMPFGPMPKFSPRDGLALGLAFGVLFGLYLVTERVVL